MKQADKDKGLSSEKAFKLEADVTILPLHKTDVRREKEERMAKRQSSSGGHEGAGGQFVVQKRLVMAKNIILAAPAS